MAADQLQPGRGGAGGGGGGRRAGRATRGRATRGCDTSGTATLIAGADGRLSLRLGDLATDPGPDLRVYVVPGDGRSVADATDLGRLRGNIGTQQYRLPAKVSTDDVGAVVIWCRAFSVNFGYATLRG
jgi:hypothetical protein